MSMPCLVHTRFENRPSLLELRLLDALYFNWQPWSQDTGLNHEAATFSLCTGHFRALREMNTCSSLFGSFGGTPLQSLHSLLGPL